MNSSKINADKLFGQVAMLVSMVQTEKFGTYTIPDNWYALATAHGAGDFEMVTNLQSRLYKAQSWGDRDYPQRITQLLQMTYTKSEEDAIGLSLALTKEVIESLDEGALKGAKILYPLPFALMEDLLESNKTPTIEKEKLMPVETPSQYDIALSYAGEQADYVRIVAEELRELGINAFFAEFEDIQIEMWGENLVEFFPYIFERGCEYCAIFISKEYTKKYYPTVEKRAALSDAVKFIEGKILPIKFDDVDLPGLPSRTKYLRAQDYSAEEMASLIFKKIRRQSSK